MCRPPLSMRVSRGRHAVTLRIAGELVLQQHATEPELGVRPSSQREFVNDAAPHWDAMKCRDLLDRSPGRITA